MNTANLQLEGLIMAVAALSSTLVAKGAVTHQDIAAALGRAEKAVEDDDDHELSDSNRAATLFPIRVLVLANEAAQRGRDFTFSDYAELVGKLT
ncbi:hypothetical protein [Rhizobium grahamii]|uniref:Uncharacterized protein n=2 Tax=Rhizobium grahamii TaxID=1120045 RepID=S3HDF3_9HYPH|nr:hypothetical protein [Rhizobium grahamii]EPE96857.1 hypothetical protein RGCCGE502_18025 [Rhizobium grahamii CCGE 502]RDJ03801.1 hypothetical protein B5K06_28165 [Rhizobium grahamii]